MNDRTYNNSTNTTEDYKNVNKFMAIATYHDSRAEEYFWMRIK